MGGPQVKPAMFKWLLFFFSLSCLASTKTDTLLKKIDDVENKFVLTDERQRSLQAQIYRIKNKMRKQLKKQKDLISEIQYLERGTKKYIDLVINSKKSLAQKEKALKQKLNFLNTWNQYAMMEHLLFAKSIAETDRLMKDLQYFAKQDVELLFQYNQEKKNYEQSKIKLKNKAELLSKKRIDLARNLKSLQKIETQKDLLVKKLKRAQKRHLLTLQKLRKKGKSLLEEEITNPNLKFVFDKSFFEQKASLHHPVSGRVLSHFGVEKDPKHKFKIFNKGVYFSTESGESVYSVAAGTLIFAQDFLDYGMTLVIDHGQNYYTVYSHLEEIQHKVGDKVFAKQKLGKVGYIKGQDQSGIYFEIRHFSDAINPLKWFLPEAKRITKREI